MSGTPAHVPAQEPAALPLAPRGLRFVLLAHPTVQAIRFVAKAVVASLLTSEELGEATFASIFMFGAAYAAIFGLDEALVHAPRLDAPSWRAMKALHARTGIAVTLLTAACAVIVGGFGDHPLFGTLLLVLAPVVWIGNFAVLPTALLVRARAYRSVYALDLAQVLVLGGTTWIAAACGLGAYSLVVGWYANALTAAFVATRLARPHVPVHESGGAEEWSKTRAFGGRLMGAALANFAVERLDGAAIGAAIGRAALGLYELAQHFSTAALNYASNVVERLVFPALALEQRAGRLAPAFGSALRAVLLFVLPLHVLLARTGTELVTALFPARWDAAAPLVAPLALAAGMRALDLVSVAALKAAGHGRAVLGLAWLRIALLALALGWSLGTGSVMNVAFAVCASRALTAIASASVCLARVRVAWTAGGAELTWAAALSATWCLLVAGTGELAQDAFEPGPLAFVAGVIVFGAVAWAVLRYVFDRAALEVEVAWLRARLRSAAGEQA